MVSVEIVFVAKIIVVATEFVASMDPVEILSVAWIVVSTEFVVWIVVLVTELE